jgi:hypothetical protein
MLHGAPAATTGPEPKVFDKGLIFIKDTNILLSGDKWTIVVSITLDDYTYRYHEIGIGAHSLEYTGTEESRVICI